MILGIAKIGDKIYKCIKLDKIPANCEGCDIYKEGAPYHYGSGPKCVTENEGKIADKCAGFLEKGIGCTWKRAK